MIQKSLFPEEEQPVASATGASQSWCDPKSYREIVGVDFGGGCMCYHELFSGSEKTRIPYSRVVETFESFPGNTLVVAEKAHLATPRTSKSLSQPFVEGDLRRIYSACSADGKSLRLFPHQHTRKAREWSALNGPDGFVDSEKDTDINDARGLAYYVANNNGISLAKPPKSFLVHPRRMYGRLVRQRANNSLNAARTHGYNTDILPTISKMAADILLAVGTKDGFVDEKISFTVAANVVVEEDGQPFRLTYRGRHPGENAFMRDVLMFSPFHFMGGVGRSNIEWHRFRSWAARMAAQAGVAYKTDRKFIRFGAFTPEQQQFVKDLHRISRNELKAAYREAVKLSRDFPALEVLGDHVGQNSRP